MDKPVINPTPPPDDNQAKLIEELYRHSLQKVRMQLPIQQDIQKTVIKIIADTLLEKHATVSEGIQKLWGNRLLTFAREEMSRRVVPTLTVPSSPQDGFTP